jgi:FAD/FMN-containing dehydrogenase
MEALKAEVATWPFFSTLAKAQRTIFVERRSNKTSSSRDAMMQRLNTGDNLMLFPEGTSSDGTRVLPFGHMGDGNLHFNLVQPVGAAPETFLARQSELNRIVHDIVDALGGSISAEHGIGLLKVDEMARYKSPVELDLMRRIKAALDPHGLMNPGKVLPPP